MKKYVLAFIVLMCAMPLFAQPSSVPVNLPPVATTTSFNWMVFLQQVLTNGGLALIAFLVGMIPGSLGKLLQKVVDFFSANVSHTK